MDIQRTSERELELQRLTKSLGEMEGALNEHYCDVGKSFLELAEKEDKEINQLVDQIVETRRRIAALQETLRCPRCLAENSPGSLFCSRCGTKLQYREEADHE